MLIHTSSQISCIGYTSYTVSSDPLGRLNALSCLMDNRQSLTEHVTI